MDASRFDAVFRIFGQRRLSRRSALASGAALGAAALATAATAQDATPPGDMGTPDAMGTPGASDAATRTEFLFVQSFQAGSIEPKEGVDGRYTLTLEAGLGQTVYFSDRPERLVGTAPTPQFLDGLGFPENNPPNAALVVETGVGETDIAVVELFAPVYDAATHTATYEVEVLANWETSTELGFTQ
ncbi:MAG TPA: hypothetical protein VGT61_01640, partial [Thermomicrobiales bacterium]|nr:hypothetical protein [Thermomicrobiales bacterium]